jgi:hypothetical protein
MAVASLSKLTVPLPAGQSASNQGLLMPKLKYRFRVELQSFGVTSPTTEITKQVMNVTRPEVTFENMTLDVYNSRIKYAGKHTWSDLTLTIRDDVSNNVSTLVGEQVQKQFDFFEQSSAASGIDYKFATVIEILDGGNGNSAIQVLEAWELTGCYLQKVTYQGGDYTSSDPLDIALTITFDNAIQLGVGGTNGLLGAATRAANSAAGGQATG